MGIARKSFFRSEKRLGMIIWFMLLAGWIFWLISPMFHAYFMYDDFPWLAFVRDRSITEVALTPSPGGWTTPISNITFWVLFQLFGTRPAGYYAFIYLLHICNCFLVYRFMRVVFSDSLPAILGSTLFALYFGHYIEYGPATWVPSFVQLLAAFHYMVCMVAFVSYLHTRKLPYYALSVVFLILALLTKETALSLALVLGLSWLYVILTAEPQESRPSLWLLVPFGGILLGYLAHEISFQLSGQYVSESRYGMGMHLFTNWQYLANLVMPNIQTGSLRTFFATSVLHPYYNLILYLLYFVRVATPAILVWAFWKGDWRIRYWVAWVILTYLPFVGFRYGWAGPYRYFYLPSIGFFALVTEGLVRGFGSLKKNLGQNAIRAIGAVVLVLWGVIWAFPIRIWVTQMCENSVVRREVIDTVLELQQTSDNSINLVYLVDFPERFNDLSYGVPILTGVNAQWVSQPVSLGKGEIAFELAGDAVIVSAMDE